jgi:methyltransferase family protein
LLDWRNERRSGHVMKLDFPQALPSRRALVRQLPRHSVGAEVGVFAGDFSATILAIVKPRVMYLVDEWREGAVVTCGGEAIEGVELFRRINERFQDRIATNVVQVIRGTSHVVAEKFADASLDWVYVDADHSFEAVLRDLRAYYPKVRPHGWIAGHDYVATSPTGRRYGVIEAVYEFYRTASVTPIARTEDYCASFVLRRD